MRSVLIGILALALVSGAFGLTGYTLVNGGLTNSYQAAYAEFSICGQGLRERGDVKLRGVLVGQIEGIEKTKDQQCRVTLGIFNDSQNQVPANVGAQVRAKTIFGEKWVELLYPEQPDKARLSQGDTIPDDQTIDPLEVETILDTALPLLRSIDPENLAATLEALNTGFVGHEKAAIRAMKAGNAALKPLNDNEALFNLGITQLKESGKVLSDVDENLFAALDNLDKIQRFTIDKRDLISANFEKVPRLLDELTLLFSTRFDDITRLVNSGATVISILAARTEDVDKLLTVLPTFNAAWIRNLNHTCRYRQTTDEPGKTTGDKVPGRCWRVHNLISETQGPYKKDKKPKDDDYSEDSATLTQAQAQEFGVEPTDDLGQILLGPTVEGLKP
ncbi:MAG: MCE family protein [Actinomycetota bacterium]|nr:MCE family protein [Actinomycetota bacterium]